MVIMYKTAPAWMHACMLLNSGDVLESTNWNRRLRRPLYAPKSANTFVKYVRRYAICRIVSYGPFCASPHHV